MTNIAHDIRYAVRSLIKARGFAIVAILTLALALGANTAIFSVISGILLQPLPYADPHELVYMTGVNPRGTNAPLSWPNYIDLRDQSESIEHLAGFNRGTSFLYESSDPERVRISFLTANAWSTLAVKPLLGRTFSEKDDVSGAASVVILSYEAWQKRFGGDQRVIGRQVRLGTEPDTVIGVMPPGFKFPLSGDPVEFWLPLLPAIDEGLDQRGAIWLDVFGRVRDGFTLDGAQEEIRTIASRLEAQYPEDNTSLSFRIEPVHEVLVREVRPGLLVLMCAVSVVLLIGCANVANLLLSRAAVRHREISIRSAIGATRGRIIFQLLVESVILSVTAGVLGLLLATWGVDLLVALAPAEIPRLDAIAIDMPVLLFTLALSILTGIIFGLAPALSASRTNLVEALKEGARGSTEGRQRNRIRSALVVSEIALSVFLLVGAGLLLRSFLRISGVDPGYNYRNAIAIDAVVRSAAFSKDPDVVQYGRRALDGLAAIPGVTAVGAANHLPLGDAENVFSFQVEGQPPFPLGEEPNATFIHVTPGYFEAIGIPILRGRPIISDDGPTTPRAVVVSESFARQYVPGNPIGKRVTIGDGDGMRTIVGVANDIRFNSLLVPPKPAVYVAHAQQPTRRMQFIVRAPHADTLGPSIRAALKQIDPEQPIIGVRTLEQMRAESLAGRRFTLVLIASLAVLAATLAAVGIYSIMSYTVTQRTSEIGIRMSLGAEARDIFRLVVGQAVRLVGAGLVVGVLVALAATRVMTTLLYGVSATDPVTFASICLLIGVVALIATVIPANRATRVDPLVAIRYD